MKIAIIITHAIILSALLSSCALVEMSGTMTRKTGEVMEDYGNNHEGFLGNMIGFGGRVNTTVGSAVENAARKGEPKDSKEAELK